MTLIFYYLVLPFLLASFVLKWLKKNAPSTVPEDIRALYAARPVEKKWLRAVRRDGPTLSVIGDYETRGEAVEAIYQARKDAAALSQKASFIVHDDKGHALEQIDS